MYCLVNPSNNLPSNKKYYCSIYNSPVIWFIRIPTITHHHLNKFHILTNNSPLPHITSNHVATCFCLKTFSTNHFFFQVSQPLFHLQIINPEYSEYILLKFQFYMFITKTKNKSLTPKVYFTNSPSNIHHDNFFIMYKHNVFFLSNYSAGGAIVYHF